MKFFWFIIAVLMTAFFVIPLTPISQQPSLAQLFQETPETFFVWGMETSKEIMKFVLFTHVVGSILSIWFLIVTFINLFRKEERWGSDNEGLN